MTVTRPILIRHACGAAALALVLASAYAVGLRPWQQRAAAMDAARRGLTESLTAGEQQRARISAAAEAIARARRGLEASRVRLRPLATLNQQIATLTDLAAAAQLRINQITPGQATVGARAAAVPITLGGSGRYPDLVAALERLRADHPDVIVTGYRVAAAPTPGQTAGDNPAARDAQFTLELSWFSAPDAQATPAAASATNQP